MVQTLHLREGDGERESEGGGDRGVRVVVVAMVRGGVRVVARE